MVLHNRPPNDFDEAALFRLKAQFSGYRYCPWCRSDLVQAAIDGHQRLVCTNTECGFIYYHNPVPAAGALVVIDGNVLLVKRAHPPCVGWWCIPAGFMEWDEHPADTAIREVGEETGLNIRLTALFEVYAGDDDPRNNAVLVLYLADVIGGELRAADDALDVGYFSFENLPEKIAFAAHNQALADYRRRFFSQGGPSTEPPRKSKLD